MAAAVIVATGMVTGIMMMAGVMMAGVVMAEMMSTSVMNREDFRTGIVTMASIMWGTPSAVRGASPSDPDDDSGEDEDDHDHEERFEHA